MYCWFIAFFVLWNRMDEILILSQKSIGAALDMLVDLTIEMGLYAGGALLFLAITGLFLPKI